MSSEQEFKCVFCSEVFSQKEDLQIHFRKHGDPNFNQKKPIGRSQNEADMSAEKLKDQIEVVECDVCPEVFTTISKAITHKHKMHPDHDTKYFCPWCGKLFTMKHLYKKHMQASHSDKVGNEEKLFHCDNCNVDFNVFGAINYHNKFYHRQDELPIIGHSKKLKMVLEEVVQIYYCPFCGEEHDNKVNLHKHINDDHCSENQRPNDVFRCPLCDAIFYYLDAYELHLTHHSSEDLYTERNTLMNEITDFSLETVQPLQEKIESAETNYEQDTSTMKIEDLLEFTMNDSSENTRKSKKHKKHKKSKKNAITLDEFLNMNKDVFGEGIDFEGVEEVPTQVITKRLKTKKAASASKLMSPDILKLKKQGIVVKKQPRKTGKSLEISNAAIKAAINAQKNLTATAKQTQSNALTSTDAVLSKLLNQGSQIKIVKKANQESEEPLQQKQDNIVEQKTATDDMEEKKDDVNNIHSDGTEVKEKNTESNKKIKTDSEIKSPEPSPKPKSPPIGCNKDNTLQNSNEDGKCDSKCKDLMVKSPDQNQKPTNFIDNLTTVQNNSNITKLPKQNTLMKEDNNDKSGDVRISKFKEINSQENAEKSLSENSSLNALKHLSHLITIKSVNSSNVPSDDKSKNNQKAETTASSNLPNNSKSFNSSNNYKKPDINHLSNFKNLDGITIKPTNQPNSNASKNHQSVPLKNELNDNSASDEEWHEDEGNKNKTDAELAPTVKSTQISIQTKISPKIRQQESLKGAIGNEQSSQSSVDVLKHLKNVTATVNVNSQKIPTPRCSPSNATKNTLNKTVVQKEISEDGTEIFSIDDSDSDEGLCAISRQVIKTEHKIETSKHVSALKNINKNFAKSTTQQCDKIQNKISEKKSNVLINDVGDRDNEFDEKGPPNNELNNKFSSPTPNQKNIAINNILRNLSRNITIKSRNSSPSLSVQSQEHNSRDSHLDTNEADSDSDTPIGRVNITEMDNISEDEFLEHVESDHVTDNVKIEHPDDSHSDHDDEPIDEYENLNDMTDFESQIATSKVPKANTRPSTNSNNLKSLDKNVTMKSSHDKEVTNNIQDTSPIDDIPPFAKNLSNQISLKQIKKPENKSAEEAGPHFMNQSSVNQKMAVSSNQVNTFNKETKTVKTFQTQTKTVIQEITTTVTKTIKTVNQTTKQEVRNMAQPSSSPIINQKIQGLHANPAQKNYQGMKVRQSAPCIRPKVRGQAPQTTRPAICPPPQVVRPAICAPVRANQLVPVRQSLNRPSGPRPRMPNVLNTRPSTSGQQRPQMKKPVKVSHQAVCTPLKEAETAGHFSCFKKPKESLIPVPDLSTTNTDDDSTVQLSSTVQMSKSNFSSTSKVVKGNTVVKSTQMKSEMSASSQQLSKLRGMTGLVVKTSQNQAKQTQVEEKCEMSASKRNTLEAIQKLQSQGLLVKKPRLDISEDSDHSQHGSDDMGHDFNDDFDE